MADFTEIFYPDQLAWLDEQRQAFSLMGAPTLSREAYVRALVDRFRLLRTLPRSEHPLLS